MGEYICNTCKIKYYYFEYIDSDKSKEKDNSVEMWAKDMNSHFT